MILTRNKMQRTLLGRGVQHSECSFAFGNIPSWLDCSSTEFADNSLLVSGSSNYIKTSAVALANMDLLSVKFENLNLTSDLCSCSIMFENESGTIKFGILSSPSENKTYFKIFNGNTETYSKEVGTFDGAKYWYLAYGANASADCHIASRPRNIEICYSPSYDIFFVEDDGYEVFQFAGVAGMISITGNWSVVVRNDYDISTSNVVFEIQQSVS